MKPLFLILFAALATIGEAQLLQQRKFVTRENSQTLISLKMPDNGIMMIRDYFYDSIAINNPYYQNSGTVITRLSSNFDTLWSKKVYGLKPLSGIISKSNTLLVQLARQNSLLINQYSFDGNEVMSRALVNYQDSIPTYIRSASLYEYSYDRFISYVGFYYSLTSGSIISKFDGSFTQQQVKKLPNFLLRFPSFTHVDSSKFLLYEACPNYTFLFNVSPYSYSNILYFDTSLNIISRRTISGSGYISNIIRNNSNFFFTGIRHTKNKKFTGNDTVSQVVNFISKFDNLFDSVSATSKIFKSNYSVKDAVLYPGKSYLNDNYVYYETAANDVVGYSGGGIDDSSSMNMRCNIYKFDTSLSLKLSKRIHIGSGVNKDTVSHPYSNPTLASSENNLLFINNNIIHISNQKRSQYNYNAPLDYCGINLFQTDYNFVNPTCNATDVFPIITEDTFKLLETWLPTQYVYQDVFRPASCETVNFNFSRIIDHCLYLKPPKSRFYWYPTVYTGFNDIVCINTKIRINDLSYNEPKYWNWIFPPSVNTTLLDSLYLPNVRTISFDSAGIFPIKLVTINDAGVDTSTQYITVINFIPQPSLGNDTLLCVGDSLIIRYTDPANSSHFFFGNGFYSTADSFVITTSGQYYIDAFTACGHLRDTINVAFAGRPQAVFGFTTNCNSLTATFTDSSLLNYNPSLTYAYAYKPAAAPASAYTPFSTQASNSFTFPAYDSFTVRLIVRSPLSCVPEDTLERLVVLKARPIATAAYTNNCGILQATFTNSSSIAAGAVDSVRYFLNGNQIGAVNSSSPFTYTFPAFGSYTVQQIAQSTAGCVSDTNTIALTIKARPQTQLQLVNDSVCANSNFIITATSSVAASAIDGYYWQVNNNAPTNSATNTQTFNLPPGQHTISHWATAQNGCNSDTLTQPITAGSKPVATLAAQATCGSKSVSLTTTQAVQNDIINRYYIDYGDGNTSVQSTAPTGHAYNSFGTYTLKYAATGSIGCASDTVSTTVQVNDKPVSTLSYGNNACANTAFMITANSSVNNSSIPTYYWQVGSNIPTSTVTNTQSFNLPAGQYQIKHWAQAQNGCLGDTVLQAVTVDAYPLANFAAQNTCTGKSIGLTNSTTGATGYNWTFGDGNSSIQQQPVKSYANAGQYTIVLQASTANGCTTQQSKTLDIEQSPIAAFQITEACLGKPIGLQNQSTGNIQAYQWTWGDGTQATGLQPVKQYPQQGNYTIRLTTTSAYNCTDTAIRMVKIVPVKITATKDTTIAQDQPLQLIVSGAASYVWSPIQHLSNPNIANPVFTAAQTGSYALQVTGTTQSGCMGNASLNVKVMSKAQYLWIPNAFSPNGDGLNDRFRVLCAGVKELKYLNIYNRYGQLIYRQTTCGDRGWDGRFRGEAQNPGAYVYTYEIITYTGQRLQGKGSLLLVR